MHFHPPRTPSLCSFFPVRSLLLINIHLFFNVYVPPAHHLFGKATSTDQGHSFTTRSVDRRFTGLSAMALTPTSSGDEADGAEDGQMLGVLYEAGNKRFDGDGVWFARMPLSDSAKH